MNTWEERVQLLEALRLEYGSAVRAVLLMLAARTAILITSATLIGTVTNMYFSGLSSFKLAKVTATGEIISLLGNTPRALLAAFIAMLIGLIIVAIYSFDDELENIQVKLVDRGTVLEHKFGSGEGLFHQLRRLEQQIRQGFMIARLVLFVIGLRWAAFFVFIGTVV
ncbi:MAG: hypothetical protein A2854_01200 [Parcubacteria group bacterium RIFCSPHIGHO2_01_FULL_56_18]|nr:MAG: hypothetical protein A2854_01200 [Parcubacteria group bacterium RIFCSPHIGHO2_01_FULL_56_18]